MGEFLMPSLGADMDRGTLVEWRVQVGDHVSRGDVVASVETDKAVLDVEVFETGVVEELLVEPGESVPVGTPLARLGADRSPTAGVDAGPDDSGTDHSARQPPPDPSDPREAGSAEPEPARPAAGTAARRSASPAPATADDRSGSVGWGRARPSVSGGAAQRHASVVLSPLVRQLAERLHVDTDALDGTGPGGRVTRRDVERAARTGTVERRPSSPRARRLAREMRIDLSEVAGTGPRGAIRERDLPPVDAAADRAASREGSRARPDEAESDPMRAAIARTMERSNREIPHYHLSTTVDLAALTAWLEELNLSRPPARRVLPAAAVLRAVAVAAHRVPGLNGAWQDGGLVLSDEVDLGVVVSLRSGGLLAPVARGAHRRSTEDLMGWLADVVERSRRGALRASELADATLSVTNLGDRGADEVHGVIHPPQLALVGVGRVVERALVVDGEVVARPSVVLTLAADHRGSDGRTGSRFLRRVETLLTHPERLDEQEDP